MEYEKNFYEIAEEDYEALETLYNHAIGYNGIGAFSQNTIEKYLKHVMHQYIENDDMTVGEMNEFIKYSRTHDICSINDYLLKNNIDLCIDSHDLECVNGYYFTTRYPEEYEEISDEDKKKAYEVCSDVRDKVNEYIQKNELNKHKLR